MTNHKIQLQPQGEEWVYSLSGEGYHKLRVHQWGEPGGSHAIICVHGLTRNGRDFDHLAKALSPIYPVYCPDIVGRGASDWLTDPSLYTYSQYIADMQALIATTGANTIDWIGTSMGGLIGLFMASMKYSPIRRLVLNDVGPFLPAKGLKRIADYVGLLPEFVDQKAAERYLRTNYASFGITSDDDWAHMAACSLRLLPNGKVTLAHDPAIAENFKKLTGDVDLWSVYDQLTCETLILRGETSDILSKETATEMTKRGPKARLIEFNGCGHAPALNELHQISAIQEFLNQV